MKNCLMQYSLKNKKCYFDFMVTLKLFISLSLSLDLGSVSVRVGWCAAASLVMFACSLPASVCNVRVSCAAPPAGTPSLALRPLLDAGYQ